MIQIIALRYGPPGSGKTAMIPTWLPVIGPDKYVFIFDFDKGLNTIRNPMTGELPKGIASQTFLDVESKRTLDSTHFRRKPIGFKEAVDTIYKLEEGELAPKGFEGPPAVVVVDTITGLEDLTMNLALSIQMAKGESFGLGGGPAQQHWGAAMRYGDEFFRVLMSGEWHIDGLAHEETDKDEVLGGWRTRMAIIGRKRPSEFPAMFDEMYHHEVNSEGQHVLRTRKTARIESKSRLAGDEATATNVLPAEIDISFGKEPRGWADIVIQLEEYWGAK